jgi:hypothetical protein
VPVAIAAVIDKALAFERDRRWSNARAMRSALALAYLDTYGAPLPGSRPGDTSATAFAATVLPGAAQTSLVPIGATVDDPLLQRSSRPAATALEETLGGGTELTTGTTGRMPGVARGISTTAGVVRAESWPTPDAPAGLPSRRKRGLIAVSVGLTAIVVTGGIALGVLRGTGSATANAGGPAAATETTRVAPPPASTGPPIVSPPSGTGEAIKDAGSPGAMRPDSTRPTQPSSQPPAPPPPRSPPSPGPGKPPQLAPPSPAPPDCRVPYYVDRDGIQRIRPECR